MSIRSIRRGQGGRLIEVAGLVEKSQFLYDPKGWRPAINAYRCSGCIRVCVDLAGVEMSLVEVVVEPHRLLIRGQRLAPEPAGAEHKPVRVLALEIDYGPFEREVPLECEVDPGRAGMEQINGLLWILLPLRCHS